MMNHAIMYEIQEFYTKVGGLIERTFRGFKMNLLVSSFSSEEIRVPDLFPCKILPYY